jgi:hypothetical protein
MYSITVSRITRRHKLVYTVHYTEQSTYCWYESIFSQRQRLWEVQFAIKNKFHWKPEQIKIEINFTFYQWPSCNIAKIFATLFFFLSFYIPPTRFPFIADDTKLIISDTNQFYDADDTVELEFTEMSNVVLKTRSDQ